MKIFSKEAIKIISLPVIIASLCCLSPLILVFLGLGTVAFAGSLADNLYGRYKWLFRAAGLIMLAVSLIFYLRRKKGICTLDDVKKRRNEIINIVAVSLSAAIIGYILWLYVVVEYVGKIAKIWK